MQEMADALLCVSAYMRICHDGATESCVDNECIWWFPALSSLHPVFPTFTSFF